MDIRYRRFIGGGLWLFGFGVAVVWGTLADYGAEGKGYGFAPPVNVAALETGRVARLPHGLHAVVAADAVVVQLDATPLEEEREWVEARLEAARELASVQLSDDAVQRSSAAVRRANLAIQLQEDLATLGALQERLDVEASLIASGASSQQAVAEWQRQIRVVQAKIGASRVALGVIDAEPLPDGAPSPEESLEAAAVARELDMIEGRIDRMALRAGVDGQITWIYRTEGEVVPAGEPVVQVRKLATRDVVAFLQPAEAAALEQGDVATVRRATGELLTGKLVSVGSGPQPLPMALWYNPEFPEYAVPVRIELDGEVGPVAPLTVRL